MIDWEKDESGKVVVSPLVAFETLVAHGVLCALRVHYLDDSGQLISGAASTLPLIMTPDLARGLAAALLQTAEEAERGPGPNAAN